ncbi:MAG: ABC transporter permease subunit [Actinobacteria bacterium]|nr:ABC transporter permease subunit [Actinomycetota bacterium]
MLRSFFDRDGSAFVGIDNYEDIFTNEVIFRAIRNNALWVLIVPALVTAIGLVFAVLTERVAWRIAFRTAVFMPMAISLFAAGVIWRVMDQQDPDRGAINATIGVVKDAIDPPGSLSNAFASTPALEGDASRGLVLRRALEPGDVALLGLTGIPPGQVPGGAEQAADPGPGEGIRGVVWRDFKPGGGTPGKVEPGELGLPDVTVVLRDAAGKKVDSTQTGPDGAFAFDDLEPGSYRAGIGKATFAKPFAGVSWLGPNLITPALIFAYIWVWAGFAMVVIAAGLAAIPRDVLEAARTDGASEWQTFRRVTVPLLAPVLSVVFITMLINVLKVFDIVLAVAPGSVQDDANVIALAMWRTSFGGVNDFGLGSAIAVLLFLLVLPILALNIKRFRTEAS